MTEEQKEVTKESTKIVVKNPMPFIIGDVNQHVDRILRDKGITLTKEISEAIMSFTDSSFLNNFLSAQSREIEAKDARYKDLSGALRFKCDELEIKEKQITDLKAEIERLKAEK